MKRTPKRTGRTRRLKNKPCVYCGVDPAGSVDHVPPAGFFIPPLPDNLITVPSCEPCNGGFSADDLYARTVISMRQDVAVQPRFQRLHEATFESLAKPGNQKLKAAMAARLHRGDIRLPSGVILPHQFFFDVDRPRMLGWLRRILKGLYFFETGARVPEEFEITVGLGEDHAEIVATCVQWFREQPLRARGSAVFEYKWMPMPDRPEASVWCFEFYHVMAVFGAIHPRLTDHEFAASRERRASA